MPQPSENLNPAQATRLLDLIQDEGGAGLGAAMLRLAHAAAAQHRVAQAQEGATPWQGLTTLHVSHMDKAEHGSPAEARHTRDHGSVTTEGHR